MASEPVPGIPSRRRSFAGPIVLISLGVIFLLGNMHVITWPSLAIWFAHYWPLLLILWGVIKVIEYQMARRQGYQSSGIGVGGVFLVIFIVVSGLVATEVVRVDWTGLHKKLDDLGVEIPVGNKYEYSNQVDQAVASHGVFTLALQRGSITVLPSTDEKVHVSVKKTIRASSQEEADRIDQATQPEIKTDEISTPKIPNLPDVPGLSSAEKDKIRAEIDHARAEVDRAKSQIDRARAEAEHARQEIIRVNIGSSSNNSAEDNIELHVPPTLTLELSTQRGDIEVRSRQADVKLIANHGDVTVDDLTGNATITMHGGMQGGNLNVRNVKGNVTVEGHADDSNFSNISGLVSMNGDYVGETIVQNVEQGFRFNSSRTDLETGKIQGELRFDGDSLRASNISGGFKVTTRSKDIHLEDVVGDVEVNNKNSEVQLRTSKPPAGNILITNKDGGIEVAFPSQSAFQVDATVRGGQIHSDFEQVKIQNPSEDNATASGAVGAGGKKIQLSTEHSDIEIRKSDEKSSENKDQKSDKKDQKSDKSDE
ncbi:MAG TPA: DUF4097 family beta strand repeat-containing protein [Terriglobales bacterium]|jgi:hypothetical protein|nr:DUF4097 family beta strand repeat-containing protein [Terriglobales bacterium]